MRVGGPVGPGADKHLQDRLHQLLMVMGFSEAGAHDAPRSMSNSCRIHLTGMDGRNDSTSTQLH